MSKHVGVVRNRIGLQQACQSFAPHSADNDRALLDFMIAHVALNREESRGSHMRTDFPAKNDVWHQQKFTLADMADYMPDQRTAKKA